MRTIPLAMSIVSCVAASACSTVSVRVPVMRPAEIDLRGKSDLVIRPVEGPQGELVERLLKSAVGGSGRFRLVDPRDLDRILSERGRTVRDPPSSGASPAGRPRADAILVASRTERVEYTEKVDRRADTCTKSDGKRTTKYACVQLARQGQADVVVNFDVIDLETGQNLKPKRLSCRLADITRAVDQAPAAIDGRAMLEACAQRTVADLMKAIAPWQDWVEARFETDGDLPSLEQGVRLAQAGSWREAVEVFEGAARAAEANAELGAKVKARAHWDLGLAYQFTQRFSEAADQIKKAYALSSDPDYLGELSRVSALEGEHQRLQAQLSGEGAPTP